ncbi:MAG: glycosyltransferase [Pseudomonadota bacterium]
MKVLIVVTHLLGTGHLSRALTLGRAFARAGHAVTLASGGMPAPHLDATGVDLVQLPPLRSDGVDFTRLLTAEGALAGSGVYQARTAALTACLGMAPDVVITELFPFGRRNLRDEFLTFLDTAQRLAQPPRLFCSIRDILAPPSKEAKVTFADDVISRFYSGVLVHSDPARTDLSQSWPVSNLLAAKLRYTGYVAPPAAGPHATRAGEHEILVSAGGGPVGDGLFQVALTAATRTPDQSWRLLIGGGSARLDSLRAQASPNVVLEPPRPDFRHMLFHAAASVSMCGYNTALDVLQAGTPAVFVPFDAGNEVEQSLRADSLSALPAITSVASKDLTADSLLDALGRVRSDGRRSGSDLADNGAAETVRICEGDGA